MYKYETHMHTSPVSKCAVADVRDSLECYRDLGYDGVFITNHFLDGNINADKSLPYEELIEFYFSDYECAKQLSEEIGIKVFLGVELSYGGTDFLIYGLDKEWFLAHPEIMKMKKSEELEFMRCQGALVIQAHPYREASYIDHIRLFPRCVDGVEVINAARTDFENHLAAEYAKAYELIKFAGSDNHKGGRCERFAGMQSKTAIESEAEFIKLAKEGHLKIFSNIKEH